jgi:YcaO-like protein with predicted kinase domain
MMDGGASWLPYAMVHTDFTLPLPPGSDTFLMTSSGLASGNHTLEAVCHALCELIERDAVTLWRTREPAAKSATRLDLDTVDDNACREVLARYERAGVAVSVWEVTSDVGVAAFRAAILEREPNVQRAILPMGGMGCHPAREIALLRALTEAAQSRLTLVAGSRDDLIGQRSEHEAYLRAARRFHDERTAPGPRVSFAEVPTRYHDGFEDDVGWLLARLRAIGCNEAVMVDLTKREIGIPVVRVVVPGLEVLGDLPGYLPGQRALAARRRTDAKSNGMCVGECP